MIKNRIATRLTLILLAVGLASPNPAAAATISYVFVGDINGDGLATNDGIPATGSVTLDGVNTSDPGDVSNVTLAAWEYSLIHGVTGEIVSFSSDDPGAIGSIDPGLLRITASSLSFDLAAMSVAAGPALYLRASIPLSILTQRGSPSLGVVLEIISGAAQVVVEDIYAPPGLLEFAAVPGPVTFVETFEALGPTLGDDAVLDTIVFGTTTASLRAGSDASDLSGTPGAELYLARVGLPQTSHGNNLHGPDSHQDAHPGNLWFLTDRVVDLQSGNPSFRSFLFGFDEEIAGFELDLYDWTANSPAFAATLTLFDDVGATNVQDSFVQPAAVHTGNDGIVHTLSVQGTGRFVALTFSGGGDNGIGVDNLRVTPLSSTPPSVPFLGPMGPMILALALSTIGTRVVHRQRHRAAATGPAPTPRVD